MNSHRVFGVVPLALLIVIAGCGGGGGFNANNVTVTVSPATPTVAANGQVALTATVQGLCSTCTPSIFFWYVSENDGGLAPSAICENVPPTVSYCPGGTIQGNLAGNLLTVTYFAPSTSGTYHVNAYWVVGTTSKVGTSVVAVP
jgi:hypothetical protein